MFHRNRETMIALRARRQALHVAAKIAHPRVNEPLKVLAVDAPPDKPARLRLNDDSDVSTIVLICAVLIGFVSLILFLR